MHYLTDPHLNSTRSRNDGPSRDAVKKMGTQRGSHLSKAHKGRAGIKSCFACSAVLPAPWGQMLAKGSVSPGLSTVTNTPPALGNCTLGAGVDAVGCARVGSEKEKGGECLGVVDHPGKEVGELWLWVGLGGARPFLNPQPPPPLERGRGEIPGAYYCKSKCEQLVSSLEVKYRPHLWVCWNKS